MELNQLKKIIPYQELRVIERSKELKQVIKDMAEEIEHIPVLYETDGKDSKCVLHYFNIAGSADWYIFEVDFLSGEGYGFVTLSGRLNDPFAEFGYVNLYELCKIDVINLDLHFAGITKSQIMEKRAA